jgi:CBS domain containing-hemolysin-like protein
MGSSISQGFWITTAVIAGILYLAFDAARYFAQQLSPVRLRRLSSDAHAEESGRWFQYDAHIFQLVSGALLQFALIVAFGSTVFALADTAGGMSMLVAAVGWGGLVFAWKFILALVPSGASESILRALVPITHVCYLIFSPILFPLRLLVERRVREADAQDDDEEVTDEEVQAYIDVGEEEGILEASEGKLLQSIVDFSDRVAHELMTPRIDVHAFDANRPVAQLAAMFSESKYSRIPIYEQSIDQITGIVHIKDIFDVVLSGAARDVRDLARPPHFVSETKKASELLRIFQQEHLQVAVVVDEYGGTAGLITIEDIVEQIVGDIADEHEDEEATVVDLGGGNYLVSGLLRVEQLEEMLDAELAGEDYETVAGLIFTTLGRVPKVGTIVNKNGFRFEVDRADRKRIYRVRVTRDPDWNPDSDREKD